VRVKDHERDADSEHGCAGYQSRPDQTCLIAKVKDYERPDEIELLFDLEAPEMIDVDVRQIGTDGSPQGNVVGVGQVEKQTSIPLKMQDVGEGQEGKENAVVEGKDSQGPPGVEVAEEVWLVKRVPKDSGDEESGESEEQVYTDPQGFADHGEEVEDCVLALVCPK
jgi:hypothetical protein